MDRKDKLQRFIKTMRVIHWILVGGMVFLGIVSYLVRGNYLFDEYPEEDGFIVIIPLLALGSYFLSIWFFKKYLAATKKNSSLPAKLQRYQTALLIRYAIIEIGALAALYAFIINGFALYMAIAAAMIAYLYSRKPRMGDLDFIDNDPE